MNYNLSTIDHQRFGVITAKSTLSEIDHVQDLIQMAEKDGVEFLIVRVPTNLISKVQELEKEGAFLADTLVYYTRKKVEAIITTLPEGYTTRLATELDSDNLEILAHQTFNGYLGHYHADPNLKKEDCNMVYASWAGISCKEKKVANAVILIEKDKQIAAFATVKVNSASEMEGVLFGVSPAHRNKNLYQSLMCESLNWCSKNNFRQMLVTTQITNLVVQKYWCRLGFEPINSYYTFHKWFKK
jgi:GNAT superfamily N-acetyltransferase